MQQRVRKLHRGSLLRPPGNAPSRWHLTRGFLLCCHYDTRMYAKSKEKMEENGKIAKADAFTPHWPHPARQSKIDFKFQFIG